MLVEATETFRGEPKPLVFTANRERFAWAASRILPIALQGLGAATRSSWERQAYQRNAIVLGLRDAEADDVVLLLDADEIVSRSLLERLRADHLDRPYRLAMTRHYEYLDQLGPRSACCPPPDAVFAFEMDLLRPSDWSTLDTAWHGRSGIAVRFGDLVGDADRALPARTAYDFRRKAGEAPVLLDAGRHFLAVDPSARLEAKLGRVSHVELADARSRNPHFLKRARRYGVHHHGWWYAERPTGPLPEDLRRLAERAPDMTRSDAMPGMFRRRAMRSWAWLRYCPALPDDLVLAIDKHFEALLPVLAPLLLLADFVRHLGALFRWRWLRSLSSDAVNRGHG